MSYPGFCVASTIVVAVDKTKAHFKIPAVLLLKSLSFDALVFWNTWGHWSYKPCIFKWQKFTLTQVLTGRNSPGTNSLGQLFLLFVQHLTVKDVMRMNDYNICTWTLDNRVPPTWKNTRILSKIYLILHKIHITF